MRERGCVDDVYSKVFASLCVCVCLFVFFLSLSLSVFGVWEGSLRSGDQSEGGICGGRESGGVREMGGRSGAR